MVDPLINVPIAMTAEKGPFSFFGAPLAGAVSVVAEETEAVRDWMGSERSEEAPRRSVAEAEAWTCEAAMSLQLNGQCPRVL